MLIGVAGRAGSGKGTVALHLCQSHGYTELSFAEPVYRAVEAITGVTVDSMRERHTKESPIEWLGVSPRRLLQTIGTDWGRHIIRDDIWLLCASRAVALVDSKNIVFSDLRFDNEADWIHENGGVVWRVDRDCTDCGCTKNEASHSSESGISESKVDRVIKNNFSISVLRAAVDGLL